MHKHKHKKHDLYVYVVTINEGHDGMKAFSTEALAQEYVTEHPRVHCVIHPLLITRSAGEV